MKTVEVSFALVFSCSLEGAFGHAGDSCIPGLSDSRLF